MTKELKKIRKQLHLSQDYVSRFLKMNGSTYAQIENGKRKALAEEVAQLSILFGVSTDSLLDNTEKQLVTHNIGQSLRECVVQSKLWNGDKYVRNFENLDESDQEEIRNLIRIKEQVKAMRAK